MINNLPNDEWHLKSSLPINFYIKNSFDIFSSANKDLLKFISTQKNNRVLLVVDLKVSNLYLDKINTFFEFNKIETRIVIIDAIENNKDLDNLIKILNEAESFGLKRKDEPIIAIGGGVLLDIVGLAANLYRRGVPYIKIPTTLLGIVDASIGVKTAINFEKRRNRLGTYYPPIASFLDKSFLKTLDYQEISSGIGEILKIAVIKDSYLFELLKNNIKDLFKNKFLNNEVSNTIINLSVQNMKEELENNLWEKNLERCVDFGHSFSPIPEIRSLTDSKVNSLTHGEAVTLDVIFSSILSFKRGMLQKEELNDIINIAKNSNLPTTHPYFYNPDILIEALNDTTKHRNGKQNLPVPTAIGSYTFVNDVTYTEIVNICKIMKELQNNEEGIL